MKEKSTDEFRKMEKLLNDIKNYVEYLENVQGLDVSICDVNNTLFPFVAGLVPNNSHKNLYCSYCKKLSDIQKRCIRHQLLVRARCEKKEYFYGSCYAGMEEYVFSVKHDKEYLGFISVGSYCTNRRKSVRRIDALCRAENLSEREFQKYFFSSVKTEVPPPEEICPQIKVLARLLELLYLKAKSTDKEQKNENIVFGRIMSYLAENYTKNIRIRDIAEAIHYSPSYISHIFTSVKKNTLMFYVNDLRIQKSKELLEKTDFSVMEIGYLVGFNDSNYFTTTFRKYAKTTPRKYRNAFLSNRKPST